METPNAPSLTRWLRAHGAETPDLIRLYRGFYNQAEPFREEGDALVGR
jgi:hypothetical protein